MSSTGDSGPQAHNHARLRWADVPVEIRALIGELAGSPVVAGSDVSGGFSPGFAGLVETAGGGRVFVKATSGTRFPHSITFARRELEIHPLLPSDAGAPALLWSHDDGDWVIAGFEALDGRSPELPWRAHQLTLALDAIHALSQVTVPADSGLPRFAVMSQWAGLAELPPEEREHLAARGGEWGHWALRHLDLLQSWEAEAPEAVRGTSLVHHDLRADNMVLTPSGPVIVDWPFACRGAPWIDLVGFLPSVEMQGGGNAATLFAAHPLARTVEHEQLRAYVTALAGFFLVQSWQPPLPTIPSLREFQAGQAVPAVRWLQVLERRVIQ